MALVAERMKRRPFAGQATVKTASKPVCAAMIAAELPGVELAAVVHLRPFTNTQQHDPAVSSRVTTTGLAQRPIVARSLLCCWIRPRPLVGAAEG